MNKKLIATGMILTLLVSCGGSGDSDEVADDISPIGDEALYYEPTPSPADSDNDTVADDVDNCVNTTNIDQFDSDSDGKGDACEDDDDDDGLDDIKEQELGTDPKKKDTDNDGLIDGVEFKNGTDPLRQDTDSDTYSDSKDVFPLDGKEWSDADNDGVGDNSDNCKSVSNPGQENTDSSYFNDGIKTPGGGPVIADDLGDACDEDIDGDGLHITYLDVINGNDSSAGTFAEPVAGIKVAVDLARTRSDDVYVAAGIYDVSGAEFADGVDLYGGFEAEFTQRSVFDDSPQFKTTLTRNDLPATLYFKDLKGEVRFEGFFVENNGDDDGAAGIIPDTDDIGCDTAAVYITNSKIDLTNNVIEGNSESSRTCGVVLGKDAGVELNANKISGGASNEASSSIGVVIVDSAPKVYNNIIVAGNGEHSTGVKLTGSNADIVNNTINGSSYAKSPKVSSGITFNGGSPSIINNLVYTSLSKDQAALWCVGDDLSEAELKNNLFTTFPQTGTSAVLIDCDGEFTIASEYIGGAALVIAGASVSGNLSYAGVLGGLVGPSYFPVSNTLLDSGLNIENETDLFGSSRPSGPAIDIGAIEK